MARQNSFHTRHQDANYNSSQGHAGRNQGGQRNFDKRGAAPEQTVRVDRKAVVRRQAFKKLIADTHEGVAKVATVCELSEERVQRLYDGNDVIDAPMAMHIEESLGLPAGWMESDQPIPPEVVSRLDRSLGANEDGGFTIDVDGGQDASHSSADDEVLDALSAGGESAGEVGEASGGEASDEPMVNILQLKDVFPAVHVYLNQKTDLSAASISGILAGSRNLTAGNARLFEAALNLPEGWLHQAMSFEQARAEMEAAIGDLINMPVPRRGRRPSGEAGEQSAPVRQARPVKAKAEKPAKPAKVLAPVPPAPEPVASASSVAPVVAQVIPASPGRLEPVRPAIPARMRAEVVEPRQSVAGVSLSRALISTLEEMDSRGELDNIKVSRVLSALFMNS